MLKKTKKTWIFQNITWKAIVINKKWSILARYINISINFTMLSLFWNEELINFLKLLEYLNKKN